MAFLRPALLLAGLALVVVLLVRLGPGDLFVLLAGLGWAALILPLLYAGHQTARTLALAAALEQPGRVPFGRLLAVRLAGEALQYLTFTGPLLSEPAKAWMLTREGVASSDPAGATLTEYVAYTWSASLISVAGLVALRLTVPMPLAVRIPVSGTAIGLSIILFVVVLGLRRRWPLAGWTLARLRRVPPVARRLTVSPEWVRAMEAHVFRNLRDDRSRLGRIAAYESVAEALIVLELYVLLRLFSVSVTPALLLVVEGVNKVSNSLFFFVPARAGTDEATLVLVAGAVGITGVVGLGVSLVRRARSLLTGGVGLFAAWLLARHGRRGEA